MSDQSTVTTASYRELREHLADYLRRAQAGEEIIVTNRGVEVARLGPPTPVRRRLGLLTGEIWTAPDFDETPADIIAAMEGDDEEEVSHR
ncbi:MAG TPA: type II toxin-antitoxin system prevent-host-death family antitoxin [Stellaceae bacterium]|jgi:prevent-host-death family protein